MNCRACGAEIADKAIVCFRCGAPTAVETPRPVPQAPRRRGSLIVVMLIIIAIGAWLIPKTTPGSFERILAWVVTWLVVFAVAAALRPRRPRR